MATVMADGDGRDESSIEAVRRGVGICESKDKSEAELDLGVLKMLVVEDMGRAGDDDGTDEVMKSMMGAANEFD